MLKTLLTALAFLIIFGSKGYGQSPFSTLTPIDTIGTTLHLRFVAPYPMTAATAYHYDTVHYGTGYVEVVNGDTIHHDSVGIVNEKIIYEFDTTYGDSIQRAVAATCNDTGFDFTDFIHATDAHFSFSMTDTVTTDKWGDKSYTYDLYATHTVTDTIDIFDIQIYDDAPPNDPHGDGDVYGQHGTFVFLSDTIHTYLPTIVQQNSFVIQAQSILPRFSVEGKNFIFPSSDCEQHLVLYDVLGKLLYSTPVRAGTSSIVIPSFMQGALFVRLGNQMQKIYLGTY